MTITVIDVGMGNVGSVVNMLGKVGADAVRTDDPGVVAQATKIVLPGVGAFDVAMERLTDRGLVDPLTKRVMEAGVPVLGICLGMQLLAGSSEEGMREGLGWIPGRVERLSGQGPTGSVPVPHMGWNTLEPQRSSPLMGALADDSRFYFVHSYAFHPADDADALAYTTYGDRFVSAVHRQNVMGVQFHPEKSHRHGMALLQSFADQ